MFVGKKVFRKNNNDENKKKLCQCPFRNREAPKDFSLHIFQEINFANHDKDIVYEMIRTCK